MTGSLEGIREAERPYWVRQIVSCGWLVTVLGLFGWKCYLMKTIVSRRLRRFSQIWLSRLLGFCLIRGFAVPARLRLSTCARSASSLQVVDAQGASLIDASSFAHTLGTSPELSFEERLCFIGNPLASVEGASFVFFCSILAPYLAD